MVVAAILAAGASAIPRRVREGISIVTSAAACGVSTLLLLRATHVRIVYWFGGWRPRDGVALGVGFAIDPLGAALAAMIGLLVTAALLYSWPFFEKDPEPSYHVLMLVFLGAMIGFALTGDLFNLFVFFELMSVAAYALTGMEVEHRGPLQGAINFGVMNSLGGFSILLGIALVYGRTGALNLAQIGETLATRPPDGLVVMAFTLLAAGLMVKASVVPFHFWLDDAHAVAPTTVCVLFSGVMVQLGLYGMARVYWTAFSAPFAVHQAALGHVLLGFGTVTALVGAVMAFLQRHLKRLLAFSTISHMGLFLIGVALFSQVGLAGVAVFVLSHGLAKAALFLSAGIVVYRLKNIDEEDLRGQGRRYRMFGTGVLFLIGGLSLAGLPPFGAYVGKTLIEDAASTAGYPWVAWILGVSAALSGGAVLRATARIFLGWGAEEAERLPRGRSDDEASSEVEHRHEKTPFLLVAPAALRFLRQLARGRGEQRGRRVVRQPARRGHAGDQLGRGSTRAPTRATTISGSTAAIQIWRVRASGTSTR